MTSGANSHKYSFDETGAVVDFEGINCESISRSGGPVQHAKAHREKVVRDQKKMHDSIPSSHSPDDLSARRRKQNRKSTNSTTRGRREQTRLMEQLNTAVVVQTHSLERVQEKLNKQIAQEEQKLDLVRTMSPSTSRR